MGAKVVNWFGGARVVELSHAGGEGEGCHIFDYLSGGLDNKIYN